MSRIQRLTQFAKMTGTDKLGHVGYIENYATHLPETVRTMLEIGVERGKSAIMWDLYYGHDEVELHLIDLFLNREFVSARWCINRGFIPHKGDQSDITFLYGIKDHFDVIIDDGSHRADHQIITWKHLFLNNALPGAIYVIEDLHCNKDRFYDGGMIHSFEETALYMFKKYTETGKLENPYLTGDEARRYEISIADVKVFNDNQVFITRK